MHCAKFGVQCIQDPEKPKQRACKRCAGLKEKCKRAEVETGGSRSGVDKAKTKAVATSPRGGKKQKEGVKKLVAVVVIDKIQEVMGPSKSRSVALPSSMASSHDISCQFLCNWTNIPSTRVCMFCSGGQPWSQGSWRS